MASTVLRHAIWWDAQRWAIVLLALSVSSPCLLGQTSDVGHVDAMACDSSRICLNNWLIRRDVREVYLLFTATVKGKPIPDLLASDVKILDNGKPPEKILGLYTQDEIPVRLGVLIDASGSVASQFQHEQAAAGAFLADIVRPHQDIAFVMGFSDIPEITQDFTNNPGQLWRGITTVINEQRNTALFDATIEACHKLARYRDNNFVARILIIVSDGEENSSRASLDDAIRIAQESDVAIYSIWTHDLDFASYGEHQELKKLATETGGRFLAPHEVGEGRSVFAHLLQELHSRYALAYRPADFVLDGHYRRVQLKAHKRGTNVTIHGRKGYYAGAHVDLRSEGRRFTAFSKP
jgi:VWFA-related protein